MFEYIHKHMSQNLEQHYKYFLAELARNMEACNYLELGVGCGNTLSHMVQKSGCSKCVGVDITDNRKDKSNGIFYCMTTDDFFTKTPRTLYDVIFIDASHSFPDTAKDFEHALNWLAPYGIILLHDADPATADLLPLHRCGDAYKIIPYIWHKHPELNAVTIPSFYGRADTGMGIVSRKADLRVRALI